MENLQDDVFAFSDETIPLELLNTWLNDLKKQINHSLRQAEAQIESLSAIPEDHVDREKPERLEESQHRIIAKKAECALIEQIQAQIHDLVSNHPSMSRDASRG